MTSEFRLTHVADLHLGAGQAHHLDNWIKVSHWIARERPDLVVANGDLIMGDPDEEADYALAREQLAALPVTCRFLPGNHDIGDNVISGKMAKRVNDVRRARFLEYFGEEHWSFERAGWGFVGLNSQLMGSAGQPAEAEQWTWLERVLAGLRPLPIALFLHKPLFLDHPSEPDCDDPTLRQSCIDAESRARMIDLCRAYGVRLVSTRTQAPDARFLARRHLLHMGAFDGMRERPADDAALGRARGRLRRLPLQAGRFRPSHRRRRFPVPTRELHPEVRLGGRVRAALA